MFVAKNKNEEYRLIIEQELYYYSHLIGFSTDKLVEAMKTVDECDEFGYRLYSNALALFYNASFITMYGFFEFQLTDLCDQIARRKGFKIRVKDLNGSSDFDKTKKYLEKIAEVDISDMSKKFEIFNRKYREFRNLLVHHNGQINRKEDKHKSLFIEICKNTSLRMIGLEDNYYKVEIKNKIFTEKFEIFIVEFLCRLYDKVFPNDPI